MVQTQTRLGRQEAVVVMQILSDASQTAVLRGRMQDKTDRRFGPTDASSISTRLSFDRALPCQSPTSWFPSRSPPDGHRVSGKCGEAGVRTGESSLMAYLWRAHARRLRVHAELQALLAAVNSSEQLCLQVQQETALNSGQGPPNASLCPTSASVPLMFLRSLSACEAHRSETRPVDGNARASCHTGNRKSRSSAAGESGRETKAQWARGVEGGGVRAHPRILTAVDRGHGGVSE